MQLPCNTSYCHFKTGLWVFLRSGCIVLPIAALWRSDLLSPELFSAWHLSEVGGARGNPSSAFVSQHPVYCPGSWPSLPDALALPPWRQMEVEETCAQGRCVVHERRGIPDLHFCFPVPASCWHQGGDPVVPTVGLLHLEGMLWVSSCIKPLFWLLSRNSCNFENPRRKKLRKMEIMLLCHKFIDFSSFLVLWIT